MSSRFKKFQKIINFVLIPLGLVIINVYLIYPIFRGEFSNNYSSIEVAFFTDAKFIFDHWPKLAWNPEWYLGFPFNNVYTPLLPFIIAGGHWLTNISFSHLYRILTGFFYIIGPAMLYFFVRYLTKKTLPAILVGSIYMLLPSFSYLISGVAGYGALFGYYPPWQLAVLTLFGEGPHMAALSLIPLASLLFIQALRNQTLKSLILASLSIALVALINWIGFVALVIMLLALLVLEGNEGGVGRKIKRGLLIFLAAYGLAAWWFNLTFLKASLGFGSGGRGEGDLVKNYLQLLPLLPVLLPLAVIIGLFIFKKFKKNFALAIGLSWFIIFSVVIVAWYRWNFAFLPQPPRFLPEWNLSFAVVLGLLAYSVYQVINQKNNLRKKLAVAFLLVIFSLIIYISLPLFRNSHQSVTPHPDFKSTYIYEMAAWLEENAKGQRVFTSGNIAFWLNYFTSTPQVRGAADPAATHPWWPHAAYQITTGENAPAGQAGQLAYVLLRALNVSYLVVNFPGSQDPYNDFKDPDKFVNLAEEGFLEEVYNKDSDVVYKVSLANPPLAQTAAKNTISNLAVPKDGADFKRINAYAAWVDNSQNTNLDWQWLNNQEFKIKGYLKENEVVSTQITYDKGWLVRSNGQKLETSKDVFGNLVIDSKKNGEIEIIGQYKKGWDARLGQLMTLTTITVLIIYFVRERRMTGKRTRPIKKIKR